MCRSSEVDSVRDLSAVRIMTNGMIARLVAIVTTYCFLSLPSASFSLEPFVGRNPSDRHDHRSFAKGRGAWDLATVIA